MQLRSILFSRIVVGSHICHPVPLAMRTGISSRDFLRQQRKFLATEPVAISPLTKTILSEREDASTASPVSIPHATPHRKTKNAVRASGLYEALVYEGDSHQQTRNWFDSLAVTEDGLRIPPLQELQYRERLEASRRDENTQQSIDVIADMQKSSLFPSAKAIIMAMEICISASEYESAKNLLRILQSLPSDHPTRTPRLVCSAKILLAISHTSRGCYEEALRVMQFPEAPISRGDTNLVKALDRLALGRDTLGWGVLLKSLTKLGKAETAIAVVDVAMRQGVGMTDSLLHLTIDSMRKLDKWREAEWLFNSAIEKGIKPSEMTLGSILLTLTSRSARGTMRRERIEEILGFAKHPSSKFMTVALMALTSMGMIDRAENLFYEILQSQPDGVPREDVIGFLMAGYGNCLQLMTPHEVDSAVSSGKFDDIDKRADLLWSLYMKHYNQSSVSSRKASSSILNNYLRVKSRCFKLEEAVDIVEQIAHNRNMHPCLDLGVGHMAMVLGSVEISCAARELTRLLEAMKKLDIKHDMRSLAFAVGTYVGDGNMADAVGLIRSCLKGVMERSSMGSQFRAHHPLLLVRRLETLRAALIDSGVKDVKDIGESIQAIQKQFGLLF